MNNQWDNMVDNLTEAHNQVNDALRKIDEEFGWDSETILLKSMRNEFEAVWAEVLNVDDSPLDAVTLARKIIG